MTELIRWDRCEGGRRSTQLKWFELDEDFGQAFIRQEMY